MLAYPRHGTPIIQSPNLHRMEEPVCSSAGGLFFSFVRNSPPKEKVILVPAELKETDASQLLLCIKIPRSLAGTTLRTWL